MPRSVAHHRRRQVGEASLTAVSPESRPHPLTELAGRGIQYFAGTLPLAKALRGKVSRDPRVEEDFFADRT